jgi:HEAT repeat protein
MLVANAIPPGDTRHHAIKTEEAQLYQQKCWHILASPHEDTWKDLEWAYREKSSSWKKNYVISFYDALASLKDKRAIPVLRRGLKNSSPLVRMASAYGLARLGESSGIAVLREFLSGKDEHMREYAARDLCRVHDPKGIEALAGIALSEADTMYSPRAPQISSQMTFKGVVGKDEDSKSAVRSPAADMHTAYAAGNLFHEGEKKDAARRVLIAMLRNPDWQIRNVAFEFLARGGDLSGINGIRKDLDNADEYYRFQTAETLLQFGDKSGMDVIKNALNSQKENMRLAAACCLVCIGDRSGWKLVEPQLKRDTEWILWKFAVAKCNCIIPCLCDLLSGNSAEEIARGLSFAIDLDDDEMVTCIAPLLSKDNYKEAAAVSILYLLRKREKDIWSPRFLF